MLRPRPSVISLTIGEVKEYECRRRFQRYLEVEDAKCRSFKTNIAQREVPTQADSSTMSPARRSVSLISDNKRTQAHTTGSQATSLTPIAQGQLPTEQRPEDISPPSAEACRGRDLQRLASLEEQIAAEREESWESPDLWGAGVRRLIQLPFRPARGPWGRIMQKAVVDTLIIKIGRDLNLNDDTSGSEQDDGQAPETTQDPRAEELQERYIPDRRSSRRVGHTQMS